MTPKKTLNDRMAARTPLPREVVKPVTTMYTSTQVGKTTESQEDLPANGLNGGGDREVTATATIPEETAPTSPQVHNPTSPQGTMSTSTQDHKPANPLAENPTSGQVRKYTTHLRPETIKAVKRFALEGDIKDYEVVQRALDAYLGAGEGGKKKG